MSVTAAHRPAFARAVTAFRQDTTDHQDSPSPVTLAALVAEIARRRDEFNDLTYVPRDVVAMMKQVGIYRATTPTMFGGAPMPPADFMRIVERIATADGSAAWVAAFGSANTYMASLPVETQRIIYADGPDQVFAGGLYPAQRARAVPGGWRVTGRWRFASGCMGADWIGVGIEVDGPSAGDGAPGRPRMLAAVAPAAEVEIVPNWDVVGMQGTGSHDTRVTDKFYPEAWTFVRGGPAMIDEPLFRYPAVGFQAEVHAACNVGLARAALDLAIEMGGVTKTITGAPRLADRGYYKLELARAEAAWRAARAFFYETAEDAWDTLLKGDPVSPEQANLIRLSATHAAHTSADVIMRAYRIAGMSAIHKDHRMQHIVRDSMVVTQHAFLTEGTLENAGAMLAGALPAGPAYP
ncbi:acyl-CoA dehydrogenase family protein [Methylobacterium aquaticum]|uniref:acyl-CoA dehydrogenase family protein n=1 Tax=Methylobacterium aquaticum TaxID=270351 RepID=UPI003D17C7AF